LSTQSERQSFISTEWLTVDHCMKTLLFAMAESDHCHGERPSQSHVDSVTCYLLMYLE